MKYIVPAAGFGTRMGMKPNESKEMLIDPSTGYRLIDNVLRLANLTGASVHVITRKEKIDLIEYLATKNNVTVQIIEPEGEWADTVLASREHWDEHNVLILPDTKWDPLLTTLEQIEESLKLGCETVFALHKVRDASKWGAIGYYEVTEKPTLGGEGYAWGLIGFNNSFDSHALFSTMCEKNEPFVLENTSFIFLDSFKDLTRTGKLTD